MINVRFVLLGALLLLFANSNCLDAVEFIPFNDARLNQVAEKLTREEIASEEIKGLIHDMLLISGHASDPSRTGKTSVLVGIAAPQIGVLKRIIIIDPRTEAEIRANLGKAHFDILINPIITWASNELAYSYEGCFSVPEKYIGATKRSTEIEVKALDTDGCLIKKRYTNQAAFVVQHEIDHLNGIRFPARLDSEDELHLLKNESELVEYRKNWKHWDKHATFTEWQAMKNGLY